VKISTTLVIGLLAVVMANVSQADILDLVGAPDGASTSYAPAALFPANAHDDSGVLGTRWSCDLGRLPGSGGEWIWVDLGQDYELNTVAIAWQISHAPTYTVRLLPESGTGSQANPASYTVIGTASGLDITEGPPRGDAYETWNFATGVVTVQGGMPPGSAVVDILHPVGRYLMIHGTVANTSWGNISIWEIDVDATEPTVGQTGMLFYSK